MKLLVACERSGVVRDAFAAKGWDAWSCDLQETIAPGQHIVGDALALLDQDWDLLIAHPPCTYLTVTGNKWMKPEYRERFPTREQDRRDAIAFFLAFTKARCPWAIENPVGIMAQHFRKPDQIIQPYHFGDRATKTTCLWLKGVPPLLSLGASVAGKGERTVYASGKSHATWYADAVKLSPKDRSNVRSQTFPGIAQAMAEQWGFCLRPSPTQEKP